MTSFLEIVWGVLGWLQRSPLVILLIMVLILAAISALRRAYPNWPMVVLALCPFAASLAVIYDESLTTTVIAVDVSVAVVVLIDLISIPGMASFQIERSVGRVASLQKNHAVTLTVTNSTTRDFALTVRDGYDQDFNATPDEFQVLLEGMSRATLHYELYPTKRGAYQFDYVHLRVSSWLSLWQAIYDYPVPSVIHVYPNLQQIAEYALLARTNRLSLMGVRRTRRIGTDNEFERLRDYSQDDNYRHIDWRTTARRQKLTVRDFQTSQSQRIIFMIDCGRMMTGESQGISMLDHALNALLMMSYVALRQGDSVGAIFFSDEILAYEPPRSGSNQMNRLLHASFDLFPRLVESRYDQAFLYLSRHCHKRSLVVLITNVIDEVNAHQVQSYLTNLVGKHLPLGLLLRDQRLFAEADQPSPTGLELFRAGAAAEVLVWRAQVINDLVHKGVLALDAFPDQMTAPLINSYLEIKARHLL